MNAELETEQQPTFIVHMDEIPSYLIFGISDIQYSLGKWKDITLYFYRGSEFITGIMKLIDKKEIDFYISFIDISNNEFFKIFVKGKVISVNMGNFNWESSALKTGQIVIRPSIIY